MGKKRGASMAIGRRAQVTVFVIIGIVIVAAAVLFFVLRGSVQQAENVPAEFRPAYNTFLSCIEDSAQTGISVLESQGGYINLPAFEPGSTYQPFSSDLLFLGNPIPYWYYVSGNNIEKEQVPNETFMQNELAQFINSKMGDCDLSSYSDLQIETGTPDASVIVNPDSVKVDLNMDITFRKGNQTYTAKKSQATVRSELGNLFKSAQTIYDYEQSSLFLENYTIDVLRNYAPVDGIDIQCSPKTWSFANVVTALKQAITDNIMTLRTGANKTDYFNLDVPVRNVHFITNVNWPSSYEVNPTEGDTMIASPVGNQQGLGILGFCYVPYHFVYSIKYPVLVAVQNGNEVFQFPMAVIVQGNKPREALNASAVQGTVTTLCQQGTSNVSVSVFDSNSNPVDANISYECAGQTCSVGRTSSGSLTGNFPQCANGYIVAEASGFKKGRYLFSTTKTGNINIILDKLYSEYINLEVDGKPYSGNAIINFASAGGSYSTVIYPGQKRVNLSEGDYNITVYIYKNSSITLGATTRQQCVNVPTGILGGLGTGTNQQCYNVNVPSQVISSALSAGGSGEYYAIGSELANSHTITINAPSLPNPTSLEQLQTNYALFQNKKLSISFN